MDNERKTSFFAITRQRIVRFSQNFVLWREIRH